MGICHCGPTRCLAACLPIRCLLISRIISPPIFCGDLNGYFPILLTCCCFICLEHICCLACCVLSLGWLPWVPLPLHSLLIILYTSKQAMPIKHMLSHLWHLYWLVCCWYSAGSTC